MGNPTNRHLLRLHWIRWSRWSLVPTVALRLQGLALAGTGNRRHHSTWRVDAHRRVGLAGLQLLFIGLEILRWQRWRIQVMRGRPDLAVRVVAQQLVCVLIGQGLALEAHSTEPGPRERSWILVALEKLPGRDALRIIYLQALKIIRIGRYSGYTILRRFSIYIYIYIYISSFLDLTYELV
jgi:hypothetical protein